MNAHTPEAQQREKALQFALHLHSEGATNEQLIETAEAILRFMQGKR